MSFSHDDSIQQLFKYILTALLLPVTEEQYRSRVFLPAYVSEKVSDIVRLLTEAHAVAKSQCDNYKSNIHREIVQLADDVHVYAQKATDSDGSDKDTVFEAIVAFFKATTDSEKAALVVKVEEHVHDISAFLAKAQQAIDALTTFRAQVQAHALAVQARKDDAQAMRDAQGDALRDLEGKLQESRSQLAADIALHEEYRRNAAFAAGLVIIPLVGPLGGGVAAGVYLKKAADTAERIENTKRFIEGHMAAIDAANAVIACLHVIEADLNGVIALSRGAAYALDGTIAFWQIVSENLLDIKEMINENTRKDGSENAFTALLKAKIRSVDAIVVQYKEVAQIDDEKHDAVNLVLAQLN